jgi:hypothetical protein
MRYGDCAEARVAAISALDAMADVDSVLPTNSHKDDCAMSRDAARAEEPTNAHTKTLDSQAVLSSAFVAQT